MNFKMIFLANKRSKRKGKDMKKTKSLWKQILFIVLACSGIMVFWGFGSVSAKNDDFKVGDRVEVSVSGLVGDRYYEPCVVTQVLSNGYWVKCSGTDYVVQKAWVRAVRKKTEATETRRENQTEETPTTEKNIPDKQGGKAEELLKKFDMNEDGWLSGRELTDCQCKDFDTNGDNEVTKAEFLAGMNQKRETDDDDDPDEKINRNDDCDYSPPTGKVSNNDKFSASLAKRKIYERYRMFADGTGQAPLQVGVSFLSLQLGNSFTNTQRDGFRINNAAPVGVTIYQLKADLIVCEQYRDRTNKRRIESKYACFKNKDAEWVCGIDGFPKITQLN
jgi:hypothetical protein